MCGVGSSPTILTTYFLFVPPFREAPKQGAFARPVDFLKIFCYNNIVKKNKGGCANDNFSGNVSGDYFIG